MPYVGSGDERIYYESHGNGPPLILIHAISAGAGMWRDQIEHFSRDWTVVVFDARGVGRSAPIRGWRHILDHMVDDVARLYSHLRLEPASVCGVSFGGVIAQHFATRYPERIKRLIIVDSYGDSRPTSPAKALWLASVYLGSLANLIPSRILASIIRSQYRRWPRAAEYLGQAITELRPVDAFKTRLAINLVNYPPALNAAHYPILGVVGNDSWPRSLTFMKELCRAVPRARLVQIDDANDPTPLCQPQAFNKVLSEFLRNS